MPQFCAVPDCRSNSLRDQISFFRFPSEFDNSSGKINPLKKERREAWIRALGRSDLTENKIKNQRICEKHFVSGRPALLEDKADPDWQPSLNLGHRDGNFDFERSLTEETKRIHITPLLDHNYASKPPPLPAIALSMDSNIPEMVENEDFSEDQEETLPEIKKEKEFIEEKDQKIIPVIKQEEPKVKIESNEESSKNDEKPVKKVEDKKKKLPKAEKERTDSTNSQSWEEEDWVTRCICGFDHDDGYMISCDKCMVWQHVDCMELERDNIPETYHCEECSPRTVDQAFARKLQANKKRIFDKLAKIDEAEKAKALAEASSEEASDSGTDENAGRKSNGKRKKRETPNMPSKVKKKKILTKRESRSKMPPEPTVEAKIPSELRTWIDTYEEAITNHYSPELRARVSSLKNVEVHCPKRLFKAYENLDSRTIVRPSNSSAHPKMLVAGEEIPPSEPIVEIRGKYMLARGPGQPEKPEPGPSKTNPRDNLVFRHTLFGPGSLKTHVEVDTSTYGNRARFIRSSCKPNSQILHCIEKGTLHLYIVSSERIEAGSEVTLAHRPGVSCALLQNCSLLGDSRSKGRRKVLKERKKTDARQNNNYVKSYPQQRKRAGPSERTYLNKTTKSSGGEASKNLTSARLPITDQLKSTESKFLQSNSLKKP